MRIRGDKLRLLAEQSGVTADELAHAVERTGLKGDRAASAVRNWMGGRDHPRCKAADVARLAEALGCQARDLVRFTSSVRYSRGSTRKARLVADMVRGRTVEDALNVLAFSPKRAATNIRKALSAAVADAEAAEADVGNLIVAESRVDEGSQIKRFRPKDRGRAHQIIKQTSHITIGVEERG
ncbi:MAG TPA: 50S ribosomal protein L22 [Phycisphaerales bacterium]|nr:50S ribosomal protein L22 [Phycisphaerales bacterium]